MSSMQQWIKIGRQSSGMEPSGGFSEIRSGVFHGQLGIRTAFRFFRLASQPTETLVPFNVTWSGYSAVQIVVVEASAYNNVSSGLRHKKPEWPAESPICLLFGGSV